ncbi:LysR substrate-binding domain-containing protein [Novosphingobium sp. BW1]|uniref:LysR substrate-binding domain-containing protein n=1 Tax=Novosphingobium sp. BW1 TaxID=2592621 RepID=UPI0011DE82A2|nr:LysR substrate-binding domain-containing protein [Novosphingobium sp. BW1]TYC90114.1 hypothetical protein FMM79_08855 [Novosphingobium sp. BW1]
MTPRRRQLEQPNRRRSTYQTSKAVQTNRATSAIDGLGLCYLPRDYLDAQIESGELVPVMEDWCPPFPGYHLYYPSRRQQSPALAAFVAAVRYRG